MSVGTSAAIIGLVGAGIGAAGSIASSVIGSNAAHDAGEQQAQAANAAGRLAQDSAATAASGVDAATTQANDILKGLPAEVRQVLAPYLDLGESGTRTLRDLLASGGDLDKKFSFEPGDLTKTPGYQFTLSQGMEAIKRAASAQGKSLGGGTLKSLARYGEGVASTTYGQEFQRALDTFNTNRQSTALRLSGLLDTTRIGQSSATDVGNTIQASEVGQAGNLLNAARYRGDTGLEAARIAAGATTDAAAARAAGTVGSANAWSAGIGGAANDIGSYFAYRNLLGRANPQRGTNSPAFNMPLRAPASLYDFTLMSSTPYGGDNTP